MYVPIWDLECRECDSAPVVGRIDDGGNLRSTGLCGVCFFNDRYMIDWDNWNDTFETTE